MRQFGLVLFITTIFFSGSLYAADNCPASLRYANGQTLRGNYGYFYHPNGQTLLGNYGYLYFSNGQTLRGNYGYLYYPNGQTLQGNYGYLYWPNGNTMLGNYGYWYHDNGQTLKGNYGYFYYANGQTARGNYGYLYYENGNRANNAVIVTAAAGRQAKASFYVTSTTDELTLEFPALEDTNGVLVGLKRIGDGTNLYPEFRISTGNPGETVYLSWDENGLNCDIRNQTPGRFTLYHNVGTLEVEVNPGYSVEEVRRALQEALDNL